MGIAALSPAYESLFRQVFALFSSQLTDPMSFFPVFEQGQ